MKGIVATAHNSAMLRFHKPHFLIFLKGFNKRIRGRGRNIVLLMHDGSCESQAVTTLHNGACDNLAQWGL